MPHSIYSIYKIFKIRSELEEVYLNLVIQSFAIALIGVFIPIYLLRIGFALNSVFIFMITYVGMFGFFSPLAANIASRIGLKHTIGWRAPLFILFLFFLLAVGNFHVNVFVLFLIAFIGGLANALYWTPLNSEFVVNSDKIHSGKEVSEFRAFPGFATMIAPLIGAMVLVYMEFSILFVLAIVLIALSVVPLFATADYRGSYHFKPKFSNLRLNKSLSFSFFSRGVLLAGELILWPLYIFLAIGSVVPVGAATFLSGLGVILLTLLAGWASDRMDRNKLMKIGALTYSAVWFSRIFATTTLEVFLLSFLGGLFYALIVVPFFASFCDFARERNVLSTVVFRAVWINVGRVALLFLLLFVAAKFQFAFALAGIFSLAFLIPFKYKI